MAVPTSVYTTTRVRRVLACSTFHPHAPCLAVAAQRGRVHSRNLEHLISRKALGRAGSRIHVLENSLRCNTELDVSLCSVSQRTRGRVTYIYLFLIMRRTWCSLDVPQSSRCLARGGRTQDGMAEQKRRRAENERARTCRRDAGGGRATLGTEKRMAGASSVVAERAFTKQN